MNEDLYREDLTILRRAIEEPVRQMIVVEVASPAQIRQLSRQISDWSVNQELKTQLFFDANVTDATRLWEDCRFATKNWMVEDEPGLLVVADESPANVRIEDKNSRRPTLLRFWRTMNQLRENWEMLPAQTVFLITSEQYAIFSTEADHLKRWIPLKLHWFAISEVENPNRKSVLSLTSDVLLSDVYIEDDLSDKESARKNWNNLQERLRQAKRRGETSKTHARRYYLPLMASAIALDKLDEAANYNQRLSVVALPVHSRLRWLRLRSLLAYKKTEIEEAIDVARQRVGLATVSGTPSEQLSAFWTLYYLYNETKRWDELEQTIQRALKIDAQSTQFLSTYAEFLYHVRKNDDRAEQLYQRALNAEPDNVITLGSYANFLYNARRDNDGAETLYRRILSIQPNRTITLGNYANFLFEVRHDNIKAEELYIRALGVNPNDANILGNYAVFMQETRGDVDKTWSLYKKSIEIEPNNAEIIGNYANFLSDIIKDEKSAEELYEKSIEMDSENAKIIGNYANFLSEVRSDDDRAEELYKMALEIQPKNSHISGNYAAFLSKKGRNYDEAEDLYKISLEIDPDDVNNLSNYATFIDERYQDRNRAKKLYHRALEIDPNHENNLANYARFLCLNFRDYSGAEPYALKAAQVSGNNPTQWISYAALLLLQNKKNEADSVLKEVQSFPDLPQDCALALAFHRYLYFFRQKPHPLSFLKRLLQKGWTAPIWAFHLNIEDAKEHGHPQGKLLDALAPVIRGDAPLSSLDHFIAWRAA